MKSIKSKFLKWENNQAIRKTLDEISVKLLNSKAYKVFNEAIEYFENDNWAHSYNKNINESKIESLKGDQI